MQHAIAFAFIYYSWLKRNGKIHVWQELIWKRGIKKLLHFLQRKWLCKLFSETKNKEKKERTRSDHFSPRLSAYAFRVGNDRITVSLHVHLQFIQNTRHRPWDIPSFLLWIQPFAAVKNARHLVAVSTIWHSNHIKSKNRIRIFLFSIEFTIKILWKVKFKLPRNDKTTTNCKLPVFTTIYNMIDPLEEYRATMLHVTLAKIHFPWNIKHGNQHHPLFHRHNWLIDSLETKIYASFIRSSGGSSLCLLKNCIRIPRSCYAHQSIPSLLERQWIR